MKSQDTAGACASPTRARRPTPVACLQNGVENERVVLRRLRRARRGLRDEPDFTHRSRRRHRAVGAGQAVFLGPSSTYQSSLGSHAPSRIAAALDRVDLPLGAPAQRDALEVHQKLLMNLADSIEATVTPAPEVKERSTKWRAARRVGASVHARGRHRLRVQREEDKERRADRMHVQPVNGAFRGGGSSWQSFSAWHPLDRDRLPQRRDRNARPPARRPDTSEHADATHRERARAERRTAAARSPVALAAHRTGVVKASTLRTRAWGRRGYCSQRET